MPRQIIRTGLGEQEYVTASTPSGATERQITLGSFTAPSAWRTADVTTATTLQLLIGAGHLDPVAGRYWVWTRYRDASGQLLTQRSSDSVTVDTSGGVPLDPAVPPITKSYVDTADASTLAAAKAYTDAHAGSGGGAVASVFGRTGPVTAQAGDYTAAQVGAATLAQVGSAISAQGDALVAYTDTKAAAATSAAHADAVALITALNLGTASTKAIADFATPAQVAAVSAAVTALTTGSPELLNTLDELAAAIGDDPNFATTVTNLIAAKYTKPGSGIPAADLASSVQTSLSKADASATATALSSEVTRATNAEQANSTAIGNNTTAISSEVSRAQAAEQANATAIGNNTTAINNEVTRATAAEAAAQSAAISAAATDATTKANNAQSAATSAAATDATTKTNRGAPTYAPTPRGNAYDPVHNAYNWKGSNTRKLRAVLAKAINGGSGSIAVYGDSLSTGTIGGSIIDRPNSWPSVLGRALAGRSIPISGTGLVRCAENTVVDSRWVVGSGWVNNKTLQYTSTVNSQMTFTSDVAGTAVAVAYNNTASAGTFTVSVDGATSGAGFATVTPAAGGNMRVVLSGLPNTIHTVTVKATVASGSALVVIHGAEVYNPTGLAIHNLAQGGSYAAGSGLASWSDATLNGSRLMEGFNPASGVFATRPACVFIALGGNDLFQGFTLTAYINALTYIIGRCQPGSDVVIILQPHAAFIDYATWLTWCTAVWQLADTLNVPVIDMQDRLGGYTIESANGITGDTVAHLNQAGYYDWGMNLAGLLLEAGASNDQTARDAVAALQATSSPKLTATAVKTSTYTAAPGELVRVDISGGSFPINLPAASSKWDVLVKVVTASTTLAGTAATVTAAGSDVINQAGTTSIPLRYLNQSKRFTSDGAGTITVSGGDFDLTVADARSDARTNATEPTTLNMVLNGLTNRVTPVAVWDASTATGATGDLVGYLEDLAGQGLGVAAINAARPTLQAASLNGLNTLRFSATQWMMTAAGLTQWDMPSRAQPLTMYALVKLRAAAPSSGIRAVITSVGTVCGLNVAATVSSSSGYASWPYPVGGGAATSGGAGINDDTWHIVIVRMTPQGNTTMVDGYVVGANITATQGTAAMSGRLVLGAYNTAGGLPMDGDFAEAGVLQGELSLKGCERLTEYLRAKWLPGNPATPKQDTVLIEDRTDAQAQAYRLLRTPTLSSASPPLLIMNHHQGGVVGNMVPGNLGSGSPYNLARAAALAGWVVVWPNNHGDSWSGALGVGDGAAVETAARLACGLTGQFSRIVIYGMSMGGSLAPVQAKLGTFAAPVKGVYLNDPACNVKYMYNTGGFRASIDAGIPLVSGALNGAAAAGDATIQCSVNHLVGAQVVIDPTGTNPEYRTVTARSGSSNPFTLTLDTPLSFAHATAVVVSDFTTKVTAAGRDPGAWDPSYVPAGLRWRICSSANDSTVSKTNNADVFAAILASASTLEVGTFTHPGGHLEVSSYRPADFVDFLGRCV